jgi:hypothetical protein
VFSPNPQSSVFIYEAACIQDQINIEESIAYNEEKRIQDKHRRQPRKKETKAKSVA